MTENRLQHQWNVFAISKTVPLQLAMSIDSDVRMCQQYLRGIKMNHRGKQREGQPVGFSSRTQGCPSTATGPLPHHHLLHQQSPFHNVGHHKERKKKVEKKFRKEEVKKKEKKFKKFKGRKAKKKKLEGLNVYSIQYSRVVTLPSTN